MEGPSPHENAGGFCPKCGGALDAAGHGGTVLVLRLLAVPFLLAGPLVCASLWHRADASAALAAVFVSVAIGLFWLARAQYWAVRTTFRCENCGYFKVARRR